MREPEKLSLGRYLDLHPGTPDNPTLEVNLVDLGKGIGQVLPIVVHRHHATRRQGRPGLLEIVEQPELHLHPAAHGDLADLCVEAARQHQTRFLVETHSENFLLRLRRRVAEGQLGPEDLMIDWVEESRGDNKLLPIHVDASGYVDTWPIGVLSEASEKQAVNAMTVEISRDR